jgi:hypothetical protein
MTEYDFIYNDQSIKYTIDLLGREKVYVNNEIVAKSTYSLRSVKKYSISVDGEALTLTRYVASYNNAEYQVSLATKDKLIDKQTKLLIEFASDGGETVYDGNESEWLKEINLPGRATSLAWVLYILIMFQSFSLDIFDASVISDIFGWAVLALVSGTVVMFFVWGFKEVFRNTSEF